MPVRFVCDFCNAYEFESDDGELIQRMMLEHAKTHEIKYCAKCKAEIIGENK